MVISFEYRTLRQCFDRRTFVNIFNIYLKIFEISTSFIVKQAFHRMTKMQISNT